MLYQYTKSKMFEWLYSINKKGGIDAYCCCNGSYPEIIPPTKQEPSKLYHYTSMEAFHNIISTKKLYLTSLFNMNDFNEIIWFYNLLEIQIKQLHLTNNPISNIIREIIKTNLLNAYSISFTTKKDKYDKWEIYGSKHTGICFEIAPKILPIKRDLPIRNAEGEMILNTCSFLKINYNKNEQKKIIKDILKLAIKNKKETFDYANYLSKIAYTCKNPVFSDESEWRILYTPFVQNPLRKIEILDNKEFKISNIKLHIKNGKHSQYCEIPILNGFITKIIIGSKCKYNIHDIKNLLKTFNFDLSKYPILIEKSKI